MNDNLRRLMTEMQQARNLMEATPGAPYQSTGNIGQDYSQLRNKVKETITELEGLVEKYERNMQSLWGILGQKSIGIGSAMKGQSKKIEQMGMEIEKLTQEAQSIRSDYEKTVDGLKEWIRQLEGMNKSAQTKNMDLSRKLADKERDYDDLQQRYDDLQQDKFYRSDDEGEDGPQVEELKVQLQKSLEKISRAEKAAKEAHSRYEQEVQRHQQTAGERDSLRTDLGAARGELDQERGAHAQTRQALGDKGRDHDALQAEFEQAKELFGNYVEALRGEIARLNSILEQRPEYKAGKTDQMDSGPYRDADSPAAAFQSRKEHRRQWGQFNLKEHLERAVQKQTKKSWF